MQKPRPQIAVIDDDVLALDAARSVLSELGEVHTFTCVQSAEPWVRRHAPAAIFLDLNLKGTDSLATVRAWRGRFPEVEIAVHSGEVRVERAIDCMREGASDYLVKPFRREDLILVARRALEKRELKRRVEALDPLIRPRPVELIGESPAIEEVRNKAKALAGQSQLNILILGESGTGKEVAARLFHQQEPDRPFVVANMPAIPASLMEAELFGVEQGAFTDAKKARAGKFEMAHGGDIFLDEIGDLALETQAKLLRTLQEKQVERLGSARPRQVEFRVISATNQPLARLIAEGKFREDLMYRLSDMVLRMPALRERREDIPLLARHFVEKYTPPSQAAPTLGKRALTALGAYGWPGNVRQLESTIKRALVFRRGDVIDEIEVYDPLTLGETPTTAHGDHMAVHERTLIETVLRKHGGNRGAAIAELGLSRATFYRKIQALGIPLQG